MAHSDGWIGVDLDSTLAHYDRWRGPGHIGVPVKEMLERVKKWIAQGKTVKLFTARICPPPYNAPAKEIAERGMERAAFLRAWTEWCIANDLPVLEVTCSKDFAMIELWDDRAKQVIPNQGVAVEDLVVGHLKECFGMQS